MYKIGFLMLVFVFIAGAVFAPLQGTHAVTTALPPQGAAASNVQRDWCPRIEGDQSDFVWNKKDPAYGTVTVDSSKRNITGGLVPCGRGCDDPTTLVNEAADCNLCSFFYLFNNIVNWAIKIILPAIALLFIVFGGLTIATSRGNPARSSKGKDIIIWTFAGYAVMFVGWMVLNSFLSGIGVVEWTGLQGGLQEGWWQFSCGL